MRQRAGDLGGDCAIELASSGGTRIAARLPLAVEG
jgi:signal transduction histidine kinase